MNVLRARWHFLLYFILGFLVGIIYLNMFASQYLNQSTLFSPYYIEQYQNLKMDQQEYLLHILQLRILPFLFLVVAGYTRFGKIAAAVELVWCGFSFGFVVSSVIMSMGIRGIPFILIALFPQFLFYIAAYLLLLFNIYYTKAFQWNYSKITVTALLLGLGVLSEGYLNPLFMGIL
ncbi:stage II sporulation protein M [Hespellia stercorisuis]|uniref:Stage II sporulation protein M n=1 Tax=Hespellia stercorisuis DSM 15480 TaxID=1121950 RepID=A0A1M6NR84_9FIRM|nr:stage II sporulation protein M [Hespellia stercorisuis]SHJ98204.1 Stage II sporulation protein M [Hespellia stercorisuis DSM 15480]